MRIVLALAMALCAAPLGAQEGTRPIRSAVFVERSDGPTLVVEPAARFRKGDRVVTVMHWEAAAEPFTVTNPVPVGLQFERASADFLLVSIDGGRTWSAPASARPEQVTHLRWQAGKRGGKLSYSAIVR
ncbi:hypothetical protein [Tsuneonella sp. HG222]